MIYKWKNRKEINVFSVWLTMVLMIGTLGSLKSQSMNPLLSIHQDDVKMVFRYGDIKISPKENVMYYWTKYRKVHHTKGGYAGQLLDGKYEEFFISGQLKVNGTFKKGAKTGIWKSWYENGMTEEVVHWTKGVQHGHYVFYYDNGATKEEGHFKNGKKHGVVHQYDKEGEKSRIRFKNGTQVDRTYKEKQIQEEKETQKKEQEERRKQRKFEREERKAARAKPEREEKESITQKVKSWWLNRKSKQKE